MLSVISSFGLPVSPDSPQQASTLALSNTGQNKSYYRYCC